MADRKAKRADKKMLKCSAAGGAAKIEKHVLAIAGIKPAADPQMNVSLELRADYVIDLRERHDRGPLPNVTIEGAGAVIVDAKPARD